MRKLFTLVCAAVFSLGMMAASYVPQGILTVKKDTVIYCTNITAAGTPATDWVVVPSHGTSTTKYTNTNGDEVGNPNGIVDNLPTISSNVAMIQIKTDGNTYTSEKRTVLMHVRGVSKVIAHAQAPNTNRGIAIGCDVYSASLETPTEVASVVRATAGSMIVQKDGLDPDKEYVFAFYGKTGQSLFYAVEFIAGKGTPICENPTVTISDEWSDANNGYLVTLTNNEAGATLTYSVDGGDFTAYTAPFYVGSKASVVAKASKEGYIDATASATAPLHILIREIEKDTLILAVGDTVSEKMEVHAPHISLILNDASWQNKSKAAVDSDAPEEFGYTASVAGNTNPTVTNNVPSAGCFYTFLPQVNGTLEIGAKINKNKNLCVSEEGTLLAVKVNGTDVAAGAVVDKDAVVYGKIGFEVIKDKTYYVYCSGSKLSFFGFKFAEKKETPTSIDNTNVENAAVKRIVNGQLLIEKNGQLFNAMGQTIR